MKNIFHILLFFYSLVGSAQAQGLNGERPPDDDEQKAVQEAAARSDKPSHREAKAWFDKGVKAYEEERFADAAQAFTNAFEAQPDIRVLANIAVCLDKAGQLAEAAEAYRRYLAAPIADPRNDQYRQRLAELEALLPPPPPPPPVNRPLPQEVPASEKKAERSALSPGFWVSSAIALGCGAAVAVTGSLTLSKRDEYEASQLQDKQAKREGENLRLSTNVLAGAAAVSATVAIVFLIVEAKKRKKPDVAIPSIRVRPTALGVEVSWGR